MRLCASIIASLSCLIVLCAAGVREASCLPMAEVKIVRQGGSTAGETVAVFSSEVAADSVSREQGLSGRESLEEGKAMLFVLPNKESSFWMKDMKFAIDIVFFDRDQTLLSVLGGLQPCGFCELYPAPENAAYALEVAAGVSARLGLRRGDRMVISR